MSAPASGLRCYARWVDGYARGKPLLVLGILYLFWVTVVMTAFGTMIAGADAPGPLDLMFAYTADEAFARIAEFSESGRVRYLAFLLTADLVYSYIYTATLSVIAAMLARAAALAADRKAWLIALPLLVFALDLLENVTIAALLLTAAERHYPLAWAASVFTTAKWLAAAVVLGCCVALGVMALVRVSRISRRTTPR